MVRAIGGQLRCEGIAVEGDGGSIPTKLGVDMRPKMADVAKRAGVSLATVSRVLNKSKFVDPGLEHRVKEAIEALDYQPDQYARWLSSRRSNVVGLVIPDMEDSTLSAFLRACSVTLRNRGYNLMVALSDGDKRMEIELLAAQVQSHVSGIILVTPYPDNKSRSVIRKSEVPFLYALNPDKSGRIPSLMFDEAAAARALIERADIPGLPGQQSGPRRLDSPATGGDVAGGAVVILAGEKRDGATSRRVAGFTAGIASAGAQPPVLYCAGSIDAAYDVASELFRSGEVPKLLAATSDYLAIGATRAAFEAGLGVPGDLAILGFGENIYSQTCTPSITTVRLDGRLLGERCGETIVALMEEGRPPRLQTLGFEIVPGESCPILGEDRWPR